MRSSLIILLILTSRLCWSQTRYAETLTLRVSQIKKLEFYDNKVVVHIDSVEYHDLDYPYWKAKDTYYQDDFARYKYCLYRVLTDSTTGHRPDTSRTEWALSRLPHPYLFLRDTARLDDLKMLVVDKHPYVRSYAFGALSYRKTGNLFSIIVDNLSDKTEILEYSGDAGMSAYPADLMIEYEIYRLTNGEKRKLKELINSKYTHLKRSLTALNRK